MSDGAGYAIVFVTTGSESEADRIKDILLRERAAACVSVLPGIRSSYWWHNQLDNASEVLLMLKTRASLVDRIVDLVKKNHSYTVPEVIALPVIGGNPEYLSWIVGETGEA